LTFIATNINDVVERISCHIDYVEDPSIEELGQLGMVGSNNLNSVVEI